MHPSLEHNKDGESNFIFYFCKRNNEIVLPSCFLYLHFAVREMEGERLVKFATREATGSASF